MYSNSGLATGGIVNNGIFFNAIDIFPLPPDVSYEKTITR